MRIPSGTAPYTRDMLIVVAFAMLYAFCATLLIAVVRQDRRRARARDPRRTVADELVFVNHAREASFRTQF